jgi:F0F1-type ATP synthase membrane subunit c/vacuolar-type H+-ATPase subunit K
MIGKGLLDAIARNPQVSWKAMVYAILAMALAEATSIYAFVVAFMLLSK